jgi:adenylylsulfate kinase-like enzyme
LTGEEVIIWINGTFGAGKTTTAKELVPMVANSRLFDPELVGYVLMRYLSDHQFSDFQDLAPWRTLVPTVANQVAQFTGQHLIATQSVLNESYWDELQQGFRRHSQDVFHVVLQVEPGVLTERIKADQEEKKACQWRLDHIADYTAAQPWLEKAADLVVDSTARPVGEVASTIAVAVKTRIPLLAADAG